MREKARKAEAEYRDRNREILRIRAKEQRQKHYKKRQIYWRRKQKEWANTLAKIKLATGCWRCGYKKCSASLSFHHVDPELKLYSPSVMATMSRQNKLLEICKCEVLCANCHMEVHHSND